MMLLVLNSIRQDAACFCQGGDFPSFANSDALNMHTDGSVTVSTSIPTVEEDEVLKYATSQFQLVSCLGKN